MFLYNDYIVFLKLNLFFNLKIIKQIFLKEENSKSQLILFIHKERNNRRLMNIDFKTVDNENENNFWTEFMLLR
jgi:hypothetical protein